MIIVTMWGTVGSVGGSVGEGRVGLEDVVEDEAGDSVTQVTLTSNRYTLTTRTAIWFL